jgi:hypothetical protein
MRTYQYIGQVEVQLNGFGIVKPNEKIFVDFEINHPLFIVEKIQVEKKKRK